MHTEKNAEKMRAKAVVNPVSCPVQDEQILVVPRADLFVAGEWQGLKKLPESEMARLIIEKKEFVPRSSAEQDPTYKQIIPYLVFRHQGRYFLMQRRSTASEKRLQGCYSLGIGGHIRAEDMTTDSISDWARREFYEEVAFGGAVTISLLGVLNDDSNEVGKVHVGFVYLLEGDSATISVKEELRSGELVDREGCQRVYAQMETWSQIVLNAL
ncbi:TPA: phosphoesterase [Candidatus Dependentiae bacterium]|nr:MAG: hypothetical protein UW09_C0002G0105 [candidate division TM6 bacterium GW2011_GWF2_43_87]HBL98023.1 phosphoesterase [Candidatus Dependentiae bacterium]